MEYPYSDKYMVWDDRYKQYVLTEDAMLAMGIDIRSRLSETSSEAAETIVSNMLSTVSDMVYGFIHDHNGNNVIQDRLIAKVPSLRGIMLKAMRYQATYMLSQGNLFYSLDVRERMLAIDELAKRELMRTVPELGVPIVYTGSWSNVYGVMKYV